MNNPLNKLLLYINKPLINVAINISSHLSTPLFKQITNNNNNNNDLIAFPLSGYSMLQMNNKLSLIN